MMGCGNCKRCSDGSQHTCADRYELGIRNGFNGALANKLLISARFAHILPDSFDFELGALVEPAANAWRVADAAKAAPGKQILIWGDRHRWLAKCAILHGNGRISSYGWYRSKDNWVGPGIRCYKRRN